MKNTANGPSSSVNLSQGWSALRGVAELSLMCALLVLSSWPGLTRPSSLFLRRARPAGKSERVQRTAHRVVRSAWMAGSSPAMTSELGSPRSRIFSADPGDRRGEVGGGEGFEIVDALADADEMHR